MKPKLLRRTVAHKGYLQLVVDTLSTKHGEITREHLIQGGTSCVLLKRTDGTILLLKHYRHPIESVTLEIPMGEIDAGESPEKAAKRELLEETGLKCGKLTHLASIHPSNGITNQIMHLYFAKSTADIDPTLCERDGIVGVEYFTPAKALKAIETGKITDAPTVTAILMASLKSLI